MTDEKILQKNSPSVLKEEQLSEKQAQGTLSQREVFGTLSMDALVLDQPFPSSPRRPYPRSSPSLDAAPAVPSSPSLDNADASSASSPSLDNADASSASSPSLNNADASSANADASNVRSLSLNNADASSVSSPSLDNATPATAQSHAPPTTAQSSTSLDQAAAPTVKSSPSLDRIDEPLSSAPSSSAAKSLSQREVFGTLSMDALQLDQPFPLPSAKRSPPKRDALTPEQLHRALQQNAPSSANNETNDTKTPPAHDAKTHATASKTSPTALGSTPNSPTPAHNPRTRTIPLILGMIMLLAALTTLFLLRDKIF